MTDYNRCLFVSRTKRIKSSCLRDISSWCVAFFINRVNTTMHSRLATLDQKRIPYMRNIMPIAFNFAFTLNRMITESFTDFLDFKARTKTVP